MHEAHGEQHQIGIELELGSGNGLDLVVHAHAMKLLHVTVLAGKPGSEHGKIAIDAFLVAR